MRDHARCPRRVDRRERPDDLRLPIVGIAVALIDRDRLEVVDVLDFVLRGLHIDEVAMPVSCRANRSAPVWPLPDRVARVLRAMSDSVVPVPRARLRREATRSEGCPMICWMRTSALPAIC